MPASRLPAPALGAALLLLACSSPAALAQAPVGSVAPDQAFTLFTETAADGARLSDFAGKVVLAYYYAPW